MVLASLINNYLHTMAATQVEKPKTILRQDSSVTLSFKNVFPSAINDPQYVIILEILNYTLEWQQIYQGKSLVHRVDGLPPSTPFNFRVKTICCDNESDWVEFKSATSTDQFYVRHLNRAIEFHKVPLIRKIMNNRPTLLEVENNENKTPLVQAVEKGDLKLVNFLTILGANVNHKMNITKKTALLVAFCKGHLKIIEYLLSKKADITSTDINGLNGLHYAIDSNDTESVKLAIKAGLNLNEKDNQGWTPLLRAIVMEASDEIVHIMVKSDVDVTIRDNNGFDFQKHTELARRKYLQDLIKH